MSRKLCQEIYVKKIMSRKLRLRQKKWFSYKKKSMYHEYVLHQDYSTSTNLADEKCVNVVIEYVTKHGKHFDQDNSRKLTNIVTNSQIGHQSSTFFLSRRCVPKLLPDSLG